MKGDTERILVQLHHEELCIMWTRAVLYQGCIKMHVWLNKIQESAIRCADRLWAGSPCPAGQASFS